MVQAVPRFALMTSVTVILFLFASPQASAQIPLLLPVVEGEPGLNASFGLRIGSLNGSGIDSWGLDIAYDPTVIDIIGADFDDSATRSATCQTVVNPDADAICGRETPNVACIRMGGFICNAAGWPDGDSVLARIAITAVGDGATELLCDQAFTSTTVTPPDVSCENGLVRIGATGLATESLSPGSVPSLTHLITPAYPNPFYSRTAFDVTVTEAQEVHIDVLNALGRPIDTLYRGVLVGRVRTPFSWVAGDLPGGIYFFRVRGERFRAVRRVVLVR